MASTQPPPDGLNSDRTGEFVGLYSEHYPRLQFFLMALLPTSTDAADVLQETSLVLWRKFDSFESGTNFFAWACKIARLQAMKHQNRNRRSAKVFDASTLEKLSDDAIPIADAQPVVLEMLETCLENLPDSDRKLVRRRYEPGASVAKLAADIGVTANKLSKSLGRIRRLLLACVQRKIAQES